MTEIFKYAFMQNAALSGIFLGALLAYIGIFIVLKKMSFFGDGIAHASLAGVAAATLLRANPVVGGMIAAVVFAAIIFLLEERFGSSGDAAIGIIFTSGMALGLVLMNFTSGFRTEISSFLFGNILAISRIEALISAAVAIVFITILFIFRKRVGLLALNEELAVAEDKHAKLIKFFFYLLTAASVALGIKLLGIVLVSAAIIIPASCAKIISRSFAMMGVLAVVFSELFIGMGLISSYFLNIGTGSAIVLVSAVVFFVLRGVYSMVSASQKRLLKGDNS